MKNKKQLTMLGTIAAVSLLGGIFFVSTRPGATESSAAVQGITAAPTPKELMATLSIYEGDVFVKKPGDKTFTPAREKEKLPVGTEISTANDGRAQVIYSGGTVTRLDYASRMKIERYQAPHSIRVKIIEGRIWSRIKKLFGKEAYESESGNVIATVRGTSYNHGVKTKGFDTAIVLEGAVSITCKENKKSITVQEEQKGVMNCDDPKTLKTNSITEEDTTDEWIQFNMLEDILLEDGMTPTRGTTTPRLSPQITVAPTNTPGQSGNHSGQNINPTSTPAPTAIPTAEPTVVPPTTEPTVGRTIPTDLPTSTPATRTAPPTTEPTPPPSRTTRDNTVNIEVNTSLINVDIGLL